MQYFTSSNLRKNYRWTALNETDLKPSGEPDSGVIKRDEGYEVLAFIQHALNTKACPGACEDAVSTGQRIEKLLARAPSNFRSRKHIWQWILANWERP